MSFKLFKTNRVFPFQPSFNGLPENDDIALCSMDKPKELETNYNGKELTNMISKVNYDVHKLASKDETHETDDVQSSQVCICKRICQRT